MLPLKMKQNSVRITMPSELEIGLHPVPDDLANLDGKTSPSICPFLQLRPQHIDQESPIYSHDCSIYGGVNVMHYS